MDQRTRRNPHRSSPARGRSVAAAAAGVVVLALLAGCQRAGAAAAPTPAPSAAPVAPSSAGATPGATDSGSPPGPAATPAASTASAGAATATAPGVPAGSALAGRPQGPAPTAAGVAATLTPALSVPALRGQLGAVVVDPVSGRTLFADDAATPLVPASTQKLLTAVAALDVLGPDDRFTTRVVASSTSGPEPLVTLVGGGDVSLARANPAPSGPLPTGAVAGAADLATLASRTVAALPGVRRVRLAFDASRWGGPATSPAWLASYLVTGQVSPVSALAVDQGRVGPGRRARSQVPARAAGDSFVAALRVRGITATVVTGTPAPAASARTVAAVSSPPLSVLVGHMLAASDNDYAEALLRETAIGAGQPATFDGGTRAVTADLARRGIGPAGIHLVDGSGLSREARATPAAIAAALVAGLREPRLAPVANGLGVAGVSGTVADGFTGPAAAARGRVRAKTGTLAGVSALAGTVTTASAGELVFAFLDDGLATNLPYASRTALERASATLVPCGCHLPDAAAPPATP